MHNSMNANAFNVSRPSPWIVSAKWDLPLFVLAPLWILPLGFALINRISVDTVGLYVLGIGGFGHHLPGFIRAYMDPGLFRRFRLRFTVVPAALLLLAAGFGRLDLNALVCATVMWGVWHGAMQVNGFLRIYDSKVNSVSPITARLDWLMCLAWFGLAVFHSPAKEFSLVSQYYASGGPLIPPAVLHFMRTAWDLGTAGITLVFAANIWRQSKAGYRPATGSLLIGIVLWEIFHDVQYNALVWVYQRRRVTANMRPSRLEAWIFGPGALGFIAYAAAIAAYGWIGVATSFNSLQQTESTLLNGAAPPWIIHLTVASALLHFYFDGFIWKVRETELRQGLGLGKGAPPTPSTPASAPRGLEWQWAFFLLPVLWLGFSQHAGKAPPFESQVVNLSEGIPGSWLAHFLSGTYFKGRAEWERAESEYRATVAANPGLAIGHLFLADILKRKGDASGALDEFRRTTELDPSSQEARINLAFGYLQADRPEAAAEHFAILVAAEPDDPDMQFGLGSALVRAHRFSEARPHLESTLRLHPGHSGALNYLGMIQDLSGDPAGAAALYRQALAADSGNASARANLAAVLPKLNSSLP
ncbi:MAG: tetratricopeptide repeat protein [Fibrobacteres bacterium]|nr:tetratricopeptide repeat protein [Fibrobacterota bacterium]